ncbi:NAD-dependent epimerase/dehydratase family protein [Streptosporangium soli]|nr:NAD-dependent epimerase/dehydratase family protein [Streptosporangium sp. KLBMP 9127]
MEASPRVLITGSSGVLGRHLVRRLAGTPFHRYAILPLDVRPGQAISGIRTTVGDIRDTNLLDRLMRDVDVVVHCAAALPSHRREEVWSVDVEGTRRLLVAAQNNGVERFVHISSTAVYGLPDVRPTPEDHPFEGIDPYNQAKIAAERVCMEFRDKGLCIPVLRPKTFLGPERLGIFAMLFEWASEGRDFPLLGGGDVRSQMLDVDDLCDVILEVIERPREVVDDVFNVAADRFSTLRQDFQAILDAAGHGRRVVAIPSRPAVAALRLLELMRVSPVYKRLAHKLTADSYVSLDKAKSLLNFEPKYSNAESLLRTYDWYRTHVEKSAVSRAGQTHGDAWRQGALRMAKALF